VTVLVVKRSMAAGYAGLDNDLFCMDKAMIVFGDARKVVEEVIRALAHSLLLGQAIIARGDYGQIALNHSCGTAAAGRLLDVHLSGEFAARRQVRAGGCVCGGAKWTAN
jgi:hypothetical protein